jgi:hypothetical protein
MTQLSLTVVPPIQLTLSVVEPVYIAPVGGDPYAALFAAWKTAVFGTGAKQTGVDAGVVPQFSIEDDYLYVCVYPGVVGVAIWKKTLMFQT